MHRRCLARCLVHGKCLVNNVHGEMSLQSPRECGAVVQPGTFVPGKLADEFGPALAVPSCDARPSLFWIQLPWSLSCLHMGRDFGEFVSVVTWDP